jgi:hypothetical protein
MNTDELCSGRPPVEFDKTYQALAIDCPLRYECSRYIVGWNVIRPNYYNRFDKKCGDFEKMDDAVKFDMYEDVPNMKFCMKKKIVINAKQIDTFFRVDTLEGNYKQGKPGDYLMKGLEGELYICDKDIFEKTYDFI